MQPDDIAAAADGAVAVGENWFFSRGNRFPSASIVIYRDRILITDKWPSRTFEFPRAKVSCVRQGGIFTHALRIVHNCPGHPPYVSFASCGAGDLLAEGLRSFGYRIEDNEWPRPADLLEGNMPWSALLGPGVATVMAFVISLLFKTRSLPFLHAPSILSAGQNVPTEQFSAGCARTFAIAGIVFLALTIALFRIKLGQRQRDRFSATLSPRP